jgi:RNA polymerase sigma-70 factor (ECF subfamily)
MTRERGFSDEAELIARCLHNDREAFGVLVERYAEPIFNLAYRMVGDHADARDLAQDTFLAAWKGLPQFRAHARFSTWLYRIAVNKCKDSLRARRPPDMQADTTGESLAMAELAVDYGTPEWELSQKEMGIHLDQALQAIPALYREAFLLKHVEGLSYDEMSEILGVPGDRLKMRVYKARVALRRHLASLMDSAP